MIMECATFVALNKFYLHECPNHTSKKRFVKLLAIFVVVWYNGGALLAWSAVLVYSPVGLGSLNWAGSINGNAFPLQGKSCEFESHPCPPLEDSLTGKATSC